MISGIQIQHEKALTVASPLCQKVGSIDMKKYNKDFYESRREGSRRSAEEIVPIIMEMVRPESVIDVGCGVGTWLSVFRDMGIEDIFGVDGEWVEIEMLQIPQERFLSFDLKRPLIINRSFDLAVSLEVAEHLPEESAEPFVDSLVRLAQVVLFSAAIPLQVGKGHLNEQWPDYWADHFERRGYLVVDAIRKKIWQNDDVDYWYAQNILIFVKEDSINNYPSLKRELDGTVRHQLSIVHPKMYMLNSAPVKLILNLPLLNSIFLNLVTSNAIRSRIRKRFLKK